MKKLTNEEIAVRGLVNNALAQRITPNKDGFDGFKSKKGPGTQSICECSDGGEDGCSE